MHGGRRQLVRRGHRLSRAVLAPAAALLLAGCASLTGDAGLERGALKACPPAPHCVSSLATDARHRVEAFTLSDPAAGWPRLAEVVAAQERTTVVARDDRYLRAEVKSPWGVYTDDLELLLGADGRVDVRSTSRIGYYDFGVNRERVEALRAALLSAGVIAPAPAVR